MFPISPDKKKHSDKWRDFFNYSSWLEKRSLYFLTLSSNWNLPRFLNLLDSIKINDEVYVTATLPRMHRAYKLHYTLFFLINVWGYKNSCKAKLLNNIYILQGKKVTKLVIPKITHSIICYIHIPTLVWVNKFIFFLINLWNSSCCYANTRQLPDFLCHSFTIPATQRSPQRSRAPGSYIYPD